MSYRHRKEQTAFDTCLSIAGTLAGLDGMIAGNPAEVFIPVMDAIIYAETLKVPDANTEETYTPQYSENREINTDLMERSLGNIDGGINPPLLNNNPFMDMVVDGELRDLAIAILDAIN